MVPGVGIRPGQRRTLRLLAFGGRSALPHSCPSTSLAQHQTPFGARGGNRTHNPLRGTDFKSVVYTSSTTRADLKQAQHSTGSPHIQAGCYYAIASTLS